MLCTVLVSRQSNIKTLIRFDTHGKPVNNVHDLAASSKVLHLLAEDLNVRFCDVLLLKQCLGRKSMAQRTKLSGMGHAIRHRDRQNTRNGQDGADMYWVVVEVGMSWPRAIDVFPCHLFVEAELIG